MNYQLRGIEGDYQGQVLPVKTAALSLGRSRSNEVIFTSPDVSGHHVIIKINGDEITLENLSSRKTAVDGAEMLLGDVKKLLPGQKIELGSANVVVLEKCAEPDPDSMPTGYSNADDINTATGNNDEATRIAPEAPEAPEAPVTPEKTVVANTFSAADAPTGFAENISSADDDDEESDNQTVAMQTRIASAEELDQLRNLHDRKRKIKVGLYFLALVLAVAGLFALYRAFVYKVPEKFVSWPQNKNNQRQIGYMRLKNFIFVKDSVVLYPNPSGFKITESGNEIVIDSFLGKYSDVPFKMQIKYYRSAQSLRMDRLEFLEQWIARQTKNDVGWNFDPVQPQRFFGNDNGVPYLNVSYSRTEKNIAYYGVLTFWRFEDWVFFVFKEVPTSERFRAEGFLHTNLAWFYDDLCKRYWDGSSKLLPGTPMENLQEAKALLGKNSPGVWEKSFILIRHALIKNQSGKPDAETYNMAQELLRNLRQKQHDYFNAQKIAYLNARAFGDKREQERVRNNLKSVFTSEEDSRFHKVRQNRWN